MMERAMMINRITRAAERRVFNVDVYHLQSAFKFNNLYFMTIQHIEKLVILENPAKRQQKESPFCCLQTILFSI
jgi:citrate lyase synthetase